MLLVTLWSIFFFSLSSCSTQDANKKTDDIDVALNEVRQMQECRRKADNKAFYLHKYKAEKILSHYGNKEEKLSKEKQKRLLLLRSEIAFQSADYLYQIGKRREAQDVIIELASNTSLNITVDTTQWLNYLYHEGKIMYIPYDIKTNKDKLLRGYDCLIQCYIISTRRGYERYEALTMQILSQYLRNNEIFSLVSDFDQASIRYINEDGVTDTLLACNLAERAVRLFKEQDDNYLTADALRTLASCYFDLNDATGSIECLNEAKQMITIESAPDLLASINEQLSLSYAALNDKHFSDYYRNAYLDLQDSTRQDRLLEARATALQNATNRIWKLVAGAFGVFLALCLTTIILTHLRRKKESKHEETEEELENLNEELQELRLQLSNAQRLAVEQRARVSIVNGMLPLIDRMRLAIEKSSNAALSKDKQQSQLDYAMELSVAIDKQNDMLTQWIKLHQGNISPKIESILMQDIFDIVGKGSNILSHSGISLNIEPTTAMVKADRTLTLFLVNTLMDNARKATPEGGTITISCKENKEERFAEICIADTGSGMSDEQLAKVTDPLQSLEEGATHGFGLINCKGIIDRYRKISSMFSVCTFSAKSTLGKGTAISFRLPLIQKVIALLFAFCPTLLQAQTTNNETANNIEASRLVDSLYECNIAGRYADAMLFADSCMEVVRNDSTINVETRLTLYNETAIASLSLHQWRKYRYNNYRYTLLYKECTADTTLTTYCQTMERNELQANIAMLIVLLLIVAIIPVFWFVYLRHIIRYRKDLRQKKSALQEEKELLKAEHDRLHVMNNITSNQLSTLKHETMYYPTRIRQLISSEGDIKDIEATVNYYRELYTMLSAKALAKQTEGYNFPVEKMLLSDVFSIATNAKQAFSSIATNDKYTDDSITTNDKHADDNITTNDKYADVIILANKELMSYMRLLLKRHNNGKTPTCMITKVQDKYISISFSLNNTSMTDEQIATLFSTDTMHSDFLIMRQIIREIGNTAMRYASGIIASRTNGNPTITITLPRCN